MRRIVTTTFASTLVLALPAFADGKACDLVTAEELQAVLGAKPNLKPATTPAGVETCSGKAGTWTVNVRLFKKKDDAELDKEKDKVLDLKKGGATVEERKVGGANCMAVRPGGKFARLGYLTSCSVGGSGKLQAYAVLEVINPSQDLEMRKLGPVADQMLSRLWQIPQ